MKDYILQLIPSVTVVITFVAATWKLLKNFGSGLGGLKKEVRTTLLDQADKIKHLEFLVENNERRCETLYEQNKTLVTKLNEMCVVDEEVNKLREDVQLLSKNTQLLASTVNASVNEKLNDYNKSIIAITKNYTGVGERYGEIKED